MGDPTDVPQLYRAPPLLRFLKEREMTKRHDIAIQHSSKRSGWRTPLDLYDALHLQFDFQLDVAADDDNALCEEYLTKVEDGLTSVWSNVVGACFMNPPYSRGDSKAVPPIPAEPIEPWIEKAFTESIQGCTIVGVLPFSPQTSWFRQYVYGHEPRLRGIPFTGFHAAMEVRVLPYRVTFIDPDTNETAANAPGNTCIVIWQPNPGYVGPWQPTVRYWGYR